MINIYRPVKRNRIIQPFGANYVNFYKQLGMDGHNGIDFEAWDGEEVYFNVKGRFEVINASNSWTKGLGVTVLIHDEGHYYKILFWHLKKYVVKVGDWVTTGQLLGYADNSGMSTGNHLHFGMYLSNCYGNTLKFGNGYGGANDPMPFYQNYFILDVKKNLESQISIIQKLINLLKQSWNRIK